MTIYKIEANGPNNEQLIFAPVSEVLRGRWKVAATAHKNGSSEGYRELVRLGDIPGECILLDTTKEEGWIFDPLAESESGKSLFERMKGVFRRYQHEFGKPEALKKKRHFKLDADHVKTWAFCMAGAIASGHATYVDGSSKLPSQDEIRGWPGRRQRDPMNTGQQTGTGKPGDERLPKWVDEVPVDAKGRKSTAGAGA